MATVESYNFPPELKIVGTPMNIEFTLPCNIPQEVKEEVRKMQDQKGSVIIKPKPKTSKTFILAGGDEERRMKVLLFILSQIKGEDGNPLFEFNGVHFPMTILKFLSDQVTDDLTPEQVMAIPELQYEKWLQPLGKCAAPDKAKMTQCPIEIGATMAALIVLIFGSGELEKFGQPGNELRVLNLEIPARLPVGFQLLKGTPKYRLAFIDYGPHKAEEIRRQIVEFAIPHIERREYIIASFEETDPLENKALDAIFEPFGAKFARLPVEEDQAIEFDEEEMYADEADAAGDELVRTRLIIFKDGMTEEEAGRIIESTQTFFKGVELCMCKKCKCVYCPAAESVCFRYFHKGQQVEIEPGHMEAVEMDPDTNEPAIYVKYTCCGEVEKDCVPTTCGKEENGQHERDETQEPISKLKIEKARVNRDQ